MRIARKNAKCFSSIEIESLFLLAIVYSVFIGLMCGGRRPLCLGDLQGLLF